MADPAPVLALAPMQDVTDLPFWKLMARHGGPDLYYTEYFRVYATSCLEKNILKSVTQNPTGRPAIAQMIGNDIPSLVRTARELARHPVSAIDLNLGCPAPVVYRKCAGGGLLRDPKQVDAILGALRDAIQIPFTVKTRTGFADTSLFDEFLEIFARHRVDLVTVHGRTVADMYRTAVRYDLIGHAASRLSCPVLANGNVSSAARAVEILKLTGARGLMIGRGAIRNPWMFHQIRQVLQGETPFLPRGHDVKAYVLDLYETVRPPHLKEQAHVQKMKKYLNFIGLGVEPTGAFLHEMRRITRESEFFDLVNRYLDHDQPMPMEPFAMELKQTDVLAGEHG